jgi:HK97 family phage portal protein
MGLLARIFGRGTNNDERRALTYSPDGWPVGIFSYGGQNDTGVAVNETTALAASAVYSCVAVISQAIAALPVHVLTRKDGGKQYAHPVAKLLAGEPNEYQTGIDFRETLTLQLLLWGNCYAFIERDELGVPSALLPLRSDRTTPVRARGGELLYQTMLGSGVEYLAPQDVLHVHNLSLDGITGLSPIMQARQAVGLSLALERFAARFFGSGCHAGGVLTVPSLKSEGMKEFAKKFREKYTGPENAWKVAVLEAGMDYKPTTVDLEKSQALEQRVHQIREVCRIYRVPAHKVNDLERATFSNIEHQAIEFVQDCLTPWVVKWEAECARKLFLEREKPGFEIKFNLDSLLRGDTKSRYEAHNIAVQAGFKTPNECRAAEGLPPIEGGDALRFPLNSAPLGETVPAVPSTDKPAGGAPAPAPAPSPNAPTASGTTEAGVITDQTLNGAQIAAAIDVLAKLASKEIVPFAAVELLVAVGIPREKADTIVKQTAAAPPPPSPDPVAPAPPDKSATRALIEDAARRVLTKESKALARAAKKYQGKPAELRQWADGFYAAHAPLVVRVMSAPLKAAGAVATPEDFAREHCAASVRAVAAAIDAGAGADDLADEWVDIRPGEIADSLMK